MTTLTIENSIHLEKSHFQSAEELYIALQDQLIFERDLQLSAQKAIDTPYENLVNL
jgi:hypothetical protein